MNAIAIFGLIVCVLVLAGIGLVYFLFGRSEPNTDEDAEIIRDIIHTNDQFDY